MLLAALSLALQVQASPPVGRPDSVKPAPVADSAHRKQKAAPRRLVVTPMLDRTAYADTTARRILRRAREARLQQDSALVSYDAKTYQRMSSGLAVRAIGRERVLLRTESAARVRWHRTGGLSVELTGARMASPFGSADIPTDAIAPVPHFQGRETLWVPLGDLSMVRAEVDDREMVHPLAGGAEAYYQYRTGGAMTIVLPDRRRVRLRELEITGRRADWRLFVGSFWFDEDGGQLVRAAYRMSMPMDIWDVASTEMKDEIAALANDTTLAKDRTALAKRRREIEKEDGVPRWVTTTLNPMKAEITSITVEYSLQEGRFWLPKANVAEGVVQVGFMRIPLRIAERFTYSSVNGRDSLPIVPARLAARLAGDTTDADSTAADEAAASGSVTIGTSRTTVAPDTLLAADTSRRARRMRQRLADRASDCARDSVYTRIRSRHEGALRFAVRIPCDSTRLASSPDLPKSIYDDGEEQFTEGDGERLLSSLTLDLQAGGMPTPPVPYWNLGLVRYNRVEGLSSAAGVRWNPGSGYTLDGQARLGIADLQPNAELRASRSNGRRAVSLGAYRRLAVANDRGDPLGFGSSIAHFLYGRDEGFYYRTAGAELMLRPAVAGTTWRLFAEDHRTADKKTDFSLAKVFDGQDLLPNIEAREGVIAGVQATRAFRLGLDPARLRLAGDFRAEGAAGEFSYARTAFDATLSRQLTRGIAAALTGGVGVSGGALPPQRQWYLGGAHTVRGQVAGTMRGDAFWLGRAEVGYGGMAFRPTLFGDVGWAGPRARLFDGPGRVMSGAGVGASVLDGVFRVDVARGIRPRQSLRLDLYIDARF